MKANADDILLTFHQKNFIEALPDVARQRFISANANNPKLAEAKQQLADGLVALKKDLIFSNGIRREAVTVEDIEAYFGIGKS